MNTTSDRRQRRTDNLFLALNYLLASQRQKAQLSLVVISDADGLIVGFDGEPELCEEYAAYAPFIARGEGYLLDSRRVAGTTAYEFEINGHTMFLLCKRAEARATTTEADVSAACVIAAIQGAARILSR